MKVRGSGGTASCSFSTGCGLVVCFTYSLVCLLRKPRQQLDKIMGGPRTALIVVERRYVNPAAGNQIIIQPVA